MKNIKKTALALIMACSLIAAPALSSAADAKLAESATETIEYKDGAKFTSNLYMKFQITSKKTAKVTGITAEYKKLSPYTDTVTGKKGYDLIIPNVVIYNNKQYKVDEIGNKAFKGDKKVIRVIHGKNLKKIGKEAFSGCSNMIFFLDNKVTELSKEAVSAMSKQLNAHPVFDSNVEVIGDRAFQNCTRMSSICLGSKIRKIGSKAFDNVGYSTLVITVENKKIKASGIAKDFFKPSSKSKNILIYTNVNKTCYYYLTSKKTAGKQKASRTSGIWKCNSSRFPIIKSKSFISYLTGKA